MKALLLEAADFVLGLAAILFLAVFLAGCGSDPDTRPAPPRPEVVARHEVCTVTLNPDGTVECRCEEAK